MIETTPREATVTIDGHALAAAVSPYTQAGLSTGEHVLQVQKPGFEDYRQVLTLSEQETKRIVSVNLNAVAKAEPPPVEPIAAPEPQAAVPPPPPVSKWHAKSKGSASTAGMSAQEIAKQHRSEVRAAKIAAHWREAHGLPPRENTLADSVDVTEVSRPTHAKHEPRAPRQAREPREPREAASHSASSAAVAAPAAESGTGTLQINSRPWANVYVDGQMVGHTPQMGLSLPAGRHTIKLENPTMNMSKSLSVTIHAGQTLTKVETLSE
jgi:serine/threonine-protein kinase